MPKVSAIIPSAGSGRRMGSDIGKQYLTVGDNLIIVETLLVFQRSRKIDEIVLVSPPGDIAYSRKIVEDAGLSKVARIVEGGKERQDSVRKGLDALDPTTDIVTIHDGVRPFLDHKILDEVIKAAVGCGAAIAAVPVKDTVKKVNDLNITATVPRDTLWLAQTPQAFCYNIIKRAFDSAEKRGIRGTDESSLVEELGEEVRIVMGSYTNIKITTPEDLIFARAILEEMQR